VYRRRERNPSRNSGLVSGRLIATLRLGYYYYFKEAMMSGKNTAVFGLYPDETELVEAIEQLKRAGFRETDLSILVPENPGSKDIGHEKHTKAPEGALAGGIAGAAIGGALGWLTSVGSITIPIAGAEVLIAAGPVVAILSGIGALGVPGAFIGALMGACEPEYEAKRYEGRVRSRRVLLSVHCDNADWRVRAKGVLRQTGGAGIASALESKADFDRSEKPRPRASLNRATRRRTFLATTQSASNAILPAEPPLVEVHEAEHQPID
jgi:hypothetical protein